MKHESDGIPIFIERDSQPAELTLELALEIKEQKTERGKRYADSDKFIKGRRSPTEKNPIALFIDVSYLHHTSIAGGMKVPAQTITDAGRIHFTKDGNNNIIGVVVGSESAGFDKPTRKSAGGARADTVRRFRAVFEPIGIPVHVNPLRRNWK